MSLIQLRQLDLAFGGPTLLEGVDLQIERGERVCLLGRNGSGKSTLLRVISGLIKPDGGAIDRQQGLKVADLPQEVPDNLQGSIYATVASGLGDVGTCLCRYHELSRLAEEGKSVASEEMLKLQHLLDERDGWRMQQRIEQVLSRLDLDAETPVNTLSGGVLRRTLLARALAAEPDLLLLDEPTNHLDIASIEWLEEFLLREKLSLMFITHDRALVHALATRIVELDRGRLFDYPGDYATYLRRKEELAHAEDQQWRRFDKKLAEEEVWIRKGIKARRTRNEGRVRALQQMRKERQQRRERQGTVKLKLQEGEKSGRLVADIKHISFGYDGAEIIRDFSTSVMRGDRIGIIGPNGAGKTTLIKLLLGELQPSQGEVKLGTNLQVLYFDQLRDQLDPDKTVQENLAGDQDTILVGEKPRHVIGYLRDFLFTPDRARTPVRILSGGERNRLLLARLFAQPANVLVLDEPTNDLDLETLDLLEELLGDFEGTVFLVSHDRNFLNRVVTSTIAFEPGGRIAEYVGGYDDWLRQRPQPEESSTTPKVNQRPKSKPRADRPRKLTFKEKKELKELPDRIEQLETEQVDLHERLADPDLYRSESSQVGALKQRLEEIDTELESAMSRWEELELLAND
ncbi:MAG: ABC transporter ATP-binding protein [Desulfuromonas sp.]|nr:MAG: ABC transporter ATP-binding protein [Desulfuromonas sp.]